MHSYSNVKQEVVSFAEGKLKIFGYIEIISDNSMNHILKCSNFGKKKIFSQKIRQKKCNFEKVEQAEVMNNWL